jgi:hypothetical protein
MAAYTGGSGQAEAFGGAAGADDDGVSREVVHTVCRSGATPEGVDFLAVALHHRDDTLRGECRGGWEAQELGLQMAPDTSPSAVGDPSTGQLAVFYQGKNNALWEALEPGSGWGAYERGGSMAPGTSPTAVRDPVTGKQWIYYENSGRKLWETIEPGTGWVSKELGTQMSWSPPSAYTKPATSVQETQATLNDRNKRWLGRHQ